MRKFVIREAKRSPSNSVEPSYMASVNQFIPNSLDYPSELNFDKIKRFVANLNHMYNGATRDVFDNEDADQAKQEANKYYDWLESTWEEFEELTRPIGREHSFYKTIAGRLRGYEDNLKLYW